MVRGIQSGMALFDKRLDGLGVDDDDTREDFKVPVMASHFSLITDGRMQIDESELRHISH
jgi:hypothetical protein